MNGDSPPGHMDRRDPAATLLFWAMTITGGLALAACLLLPAWFEYQVARQEYTAALERQAGLRARARQVERQIEHLQQDVAYLQRVYRREFGPAAPAADTLAIQTSEAAPWPELYNATSAAPTTDEPPTVRPRTEQPGWAERAPSPDPEKGWGPDEISQLVERAVQRYPLIWIFVLDSTRPVVMIAAGVLVLAALILLSWTPAEADGRGKRNGEGGIRTHVGD